MEIPSVGRGVAFWRKGGPMVFLFDECELDLDQVELRVRGECRPIEPQVFDVLVFLVRHRERVVTREELLDEVWHTRFVTDSALSSRIKSARRAIGDDGQAQRLIRTVHGRGYQFVGAYWYREGNHAEGRRWIAEAFAGADDLDADLVARLHLAAGLLGWLRSPEAGREHLEPAVDAFRRLGNEHYLSQALRMLAASYIGDDDGYDHAIGLADEAIERARRVGVQPLIALALTVKGELTRVHGDDAAARPIYEESLALARAAGDDEHAAMGLGNLSFLADHAGDHVEARRLGCEALRLTWRFGRRYAAAQAVSLLAGPELGLGRPERAARLIGAADEALRVLGGARHQGDLSEYERVTGGLRAALGDAALRRLRAEGAGSSLDDAVALALSEPEAPTPEPLEREAGQG
jgi:DNA-binding winged helix-turn-helix (wHTH) protein